MNVAGYTPYAQKLTPFIVTNLVALVLSVGLISISYIIQEQPAGGEPVSVGSALGLTNDTIRRVGFQVGVLSLITALGAVIYKFGFKHHTVGFKYIRAMSIVYAILSAVLWFTSAPVSSGISNLNIDYITKNPRNGASLSPMADLSLFYIAVAAIAWIAMVFSVGSIMRPKDLSNKIAMLTLIVGVLLCVYYIVASRLLVSTGQPIGTVIEALNLSQFPIVGYALILYGSISRIGSYFSK